MVESVLNKVGAFVINPRLRLILGQTENRLPFRRIMGHKGLWVLEAALRDEETTMTESVRSESRHLTVAVVRGRIRRESCPNFQLYLGHIRASFDSRISLW